MREHRTNIVRLLLAALFVCAVALPVAVHPPQVEAAWVCDSITGPPGIGWGPGEWIPSTGGMVFLTDGGAIYELLGPATVLVARPSATVALLPYVSGYMEITLANLGPDPIELHFTDGVTIVNKVTVPPTGDDLVTIPSGDGYNLIEVLIWQAGSPVAIEKVCYS